jgi:hypothetical protein
MTIPTTAISIIHINLINIIKTNKILEYYLIYFLIYI